MSTGRPLEKRVVIGIDASSTKIGLAVTSTVIDGDRNVIARSLISCLLIDLSSYGTLLEKQQKASESFLEVLENLDKGGIEISEIYLEEPIPFMSIGSSAKTLSSLNMFSGMIQITILTTFLRGNRDLRQRLKLVPSSETRSLLGIPRTKGQKKNEVKRLVCSKLLSLGFTEKEMLLKKNRNDEYTLDSLNVTDAVALSLLDIQR